jgi:sigma-B regulation protein RsbU (phosphoserine phosphatase)
VTDLSDCRILIVDDVKANIDVLVEALRDDYKLSVALSGDNALKSIEKNLPDLVLLDIMMPGIDGYEVCRRLRESPATRDVPIMFLSSLDDVLNKTRGFEAGGNDYLTKPFNVLEAKARVRSLLRAKAYSDAVKEKLASELRIAREIQLGILPSDVSECGRSSGLDIQAIMEPARDVGGDLYEVMPVGNERIAVVIGDVSGKGIPAALFMAVTTTLVRVAAQQFHRPEEILSRVNEGLIVHNPKGMFVTLFCAIFEPDTRKVSCASCGHPSPVLLRAGEAPGLPFRSAGLAAGIMADIEIPNQSLDLKTGDTLVFYTDGVTEAFDAQEHQFGERRLLSGLADMAGQSSQDALNATLVAVRQHAQDAMQSDDITIVAVRLPQ